MPPSFLRVSHNVHSSQDNYLTFNGHPQPEISATGRGNRFTSPLILASNGSQFDPCDEYLNEAAFGLTDPATFKDGDSYGPEVWQIFQNGRAWRSSFPADLSPCIGLLGDAFSSENMSSPYQTSLWNSSPPSSSISSTTPLTSEATPGFCQLTVTPSDVWREPNAGSCIVRSAPAVLASLPFDETSFDLHENLHDENYIDDIAISLLSPSGLLSFDLLPDVDDDALTSTDFPETSTLFSADHTSSTSLMAETAGMQPMLHDESTDISGPDKRSWFHGYTDPYASLPLPESPDDRRRTRRLKSDGTHDMSFQRHSPYARFAPISISPPDPDVVVINPSLPKPQSVLKSTEASDGLHRMEFSGYPRSEDGATDGKFKSVVGSAAVIQASWRRRKRPGRYLCQLCLEGPTPEVRSFTAAHNLRNHLKSHNGIKDFKCDVCERTFGNKHDLVRHTRKMQAKDNH